MTKPALKIWQHFIAIAMLSFAFSTVSVQAATFDVNTATAADIQKNLNGIGPVKAEAIVDYRRKNGKFQTTDDLLKVPGIGVGTVKKNFSTLGLKQGSQSLKAKTAAKTRSKSATDSAAGSSKK